MMQLPFVTCNPGKELTTVSWPVMRDRGSAFSLAFAGLGESNERRAEKASVDRGTAQMSVIQLEPYTVFIKFDIIPRLLFGKQLS